MTLFKFRLLDESEQVDLLYKDGLYIGKRKDDRKTVVLYQLEGFYIEIHYRKYRQSITHLHCFTTTEPLIPYLELVDVEELMRYV